MSLSDDVVGNFTYIVGAHSGTRDIALFIEHILFPFQNLGPILPMMQLVDVTGGNSSDYLELPLEPRYAYFFLRDMQKTHLNV